MRWQRKRTAHCRLDSVRQDRELQQGWVADTLQWEINDEHFRVQTVASGRLKVEQGVQRCGPTVTEISHNRTRAKQATGANVCGPLRGNPYPSAGTEWRDQLTRLYTPCCLVAGDYKIVSFGLSLSRQLCASG
jgi:hypothetical protein